MMYFQCQKLVTVNKNTVEEYLQDVDPLMQYVLFPSSKIACGYTLVIQVF